MSTALWPAVLLTTASLKGHPAACTVLSISKSLLQGRAMLQHKTRIPSNAMRIVTAHSVHTPGQGSVPSHCTLVAVRSSCSTAGLSHCAQSAINASSALRAQPLLQSVQHPGQHQLLPTAQPNQPERITARVQPGGCCCRATSMHAKKDGFLILTTPKQSTRNRLSRPDCQAACCGYKLAANKRVMG